MIALFLLIASKVRAQDINIYNGFGFGYVRPYYNSYYAPPVYIPPAYYYPTGNSYLNLYKRELRKQQNMAFWIDKRIDNAEARYRNRARKNGANMTMYDWE